MLSFLHVRHQQGPVCFEHWQSDIYRARITCWLGCSNRIMFSHEALFGLLLLSSHVNRIFFYEKGFGALHTYAAHLLMNGLILKLAASFRLFLCWTERLIEVSKCELDRSLWNCECGRFIFLVPNYCDWSLKRTTHLSVFSSFFFLSCRAIVNGHSCLSCYNNHLYKSAISTFILNMSYIAYTYINLTG